jgi:phosphoserine phosphatase RsbU/P
MLQSRPWREELEIVDRTMKAISGITDPEELVDKYWEGIGELVAVEHYVALSRRNVDPPHYLITRSSRFEEHFNPWTQRERLPKLTGGLLGEIAYAGRPVVMEDVPSRLSPDDPGRFYLEGFQSLISSPTYDNGEALNITVMLYEPGQTIDYSKIATMHWLSGLFGRGTTNLVLRNQLSAALATLDRELQIVGAIQRSLLRRDLPEIPGLDIAAHYQTSAWAGGDYYDFFPLADGRWGLFIADVSGHGTPAAVLMAITHAIAHSQPGMHTPPARMVTYLNDQLSRVYTRDESFVTAFYAVLDPRTRTLTYSCAGHNPPRLVRGGQVLSLDASGALPMGINEGEKYEESTVRLERGDLLLLYTDGIVEAMTPADGSGKAEMFGTDRLDELLLGCASGSAEMCLERIREELGRFSGGSPPSDDQTLIAFRCVD